MKRSGFTLVEMLVAISIFLILAAITMSALRTNNADRVGASAGIFKGAVEGAKSRAIKSGEISGLRLNMDPNNPRTVTSLQKINRLNQIDEGSLFVEFNLATQQWQVSDTSADWDNLYNRGLMHVGNRLEIPSGSGTWYNLTSRVSSTVWTIAGAFRQAQWFEPDPLALAVLAPWDGVTPLYYDASILPGWIPQPVDKLDQVDPSAFPPPYNTQYRKGLAAAACSRELKYRLELSPSISVGDPILLSAGTCIDMDGSSVPAAWRPATAMPNDSYSQTMDIMFKPDGTIVTPASGMLHFRICYVSDVELEKDFATRPLDNTAAGPVVPADPSKDHRAVSVLRSGFVLSSEIDRSDDDADDVYDEIVATRPFIYAVRGKEAK